MPQPIPPWWKAPVPPQALGRLGLQGLRVLEFWSCGVFRVLGFWVLGWVLASASRHFGGFAVSGVWDQTRGHGRKPTARGFWLESFGHQGVRFFFLFFVRWGWWLGRVCNADEFASPPP